MKTFRLKDLNDSIVRDVIKDRVNVSNDTDCWEWAGKRDKDNYGELFGAIRTFYKTSAVHRISYQAFKGKPGDLVVRHRCNNPPCCNPDHLELGSQSQNMKDKGEPLHEQSTPSLLNRQSILQRQLKLIEDELARRL